MTKGSPLKATGAHISIIAHITEDEARALLTRTEMANGFANRFSVQPREALEISPARRRRNRRVQSVPARQGCSRVRPAGRSRQNDGGGRHDAQLVKVDPTAGIKNPARKDKGGYRPWTEDEVAAYESRWPIGTRQRVWLDVLLYTGLRRGDAVGLGRQHVRDGIATIKTDKTDTEVSLPILPALAETLTAGPCGHLAFICGARGQPMAKKAFSNDFADACRAAGVSGSAHGLRKIAATRAANNGATVAQLEAIFGWSGGGMASLYTRAADRRRLAMQAMHTLANDSRTTIVAPSDASVAPEKNRK